MSYDRETTIVETELNLLSAINAGNVEAVLQHMHSDWDSFWAGGLRLFNSATGRVGIRETFEMGFTFTLKFQGLKVKVHENTAVVTGYLVGTVTEPNGKTSQVNWRVSVIRILQEAEWKIIHWHESSLIVDS